MSMPEAVQWVKHILTLPEIWNATAHDDSPPIESFEPTLIGVMYALACCDGEPIGVFTFHPAGYGVLWMAHTAFYPGVPAAAVAAATKAGIAFGLSIPECGNILGMTPTYNTPAVRSASRNGFHKYCYIPHAVRRDGVWYPLLLSGIVPQATSGDCRKSLSQPEAHPPPPHIHDIGMQIDPAPLLQELKDNPQLWDADPERRNFSPNSPHREMTDIWVRYADKSFFYKQEEPIEPHWWDSAMLLPSAYGISKDLMEYCGADSLGGIWITRVPAGKQIYPHVDRGWHARHYNLKVYVVLKSNEQCISYADSMSVTMKAGECFSFNNAVEHGMVNGGDSERITMICCMHRK